MLRVLIMSPSNVDLSQIPADEFWFWENPELVARFERANRDIKEGNVITVNDLRAYFDSL